MARKKKDTAPEAAPKKGRSATPETPEMLRSRDIQKIRVTKEIRVPISVAELEKDGMRQAVVHRKIAALEKEIADFAAPKKAEIKKLQKEEDKLAENIETQSVLRAVNCTEHRIFATMTIRWIDEAGTVLDEQPMPPEMLQRDFVEEGEAGERVDD